MTTYLTHLTSRVLNPAASLQPRLGSRFEPAPQGLGALALPGLKSVLNPLAEAPEFEAAAPDKFIEQETMQESEPLGNAPEARIPTVSLLPPPSRNGALKQPVPLTTLVGPVIASVQNSQNLLGESSQPSEPASRANSISAPPLPNPQAPLPKQTASKTDRPMAPLIEPLLPPMLSGEMTEDPSRESIGSEEPAPEVYRPQPNLSPTPAELAQTAPAHPRPSPKGTLNPFQLQMPGVRQEVLPLLEGVNATPPSQPGRKPEAPIGQVRSQATSPENVLLPLSRLSSIRAALTAAVPAEPQLSRRPSVHPESLVATTPPLLSSDHSLIRSQAASSSLSSVPSRANLRAAQSLLLQPRVEPSAAVGLQIESAPPPERPTVNISIGRIEVRAVPPRPAKAVPTARPSTPSTTSLSTYLRPGGQR